MGSSARADRRRFFVTPLRQKVDGIQPAVRFQQIVRPRVCGRIGGNRLERDIFAFWSAIADHAFVHPADADVFDRCSHRFERNCLPVAYFGPLRTAPVVLLFLSPGFAASFDRDHAQTEGGRAYYADQRTGRAPLPSPEDHAPAHAWCTRILAQFGLGMVDAADRVAILNIGPYHSASFHDYPMMTALASCRVSLDWAQFDLFPRPSAATES
jgi:hypothetical protein